MTTKSSGAYAPDKALAHPERLEELKRGGQPYPVHLHLIISDLCNLDCGGCAYRLRGYSSNQLFGGARADGTVARNPNRMLPTDLVKSILDDCVAMGTKAVELTGGGEPTVHPDAPEILRYAQDKGLDTALITNGLCLERMGDAAVRTQWLRVSVDAATAKTFAVVRPGVGGAKESNFQSATRNLQAAAARKHQLGTDCTIGFGFVVQKDNWHEAYDAVKLARELGADNIRISGLFSPEGDKYHDGYRNEAIELERKAVADFDGKGGFRVHGRFNEKMADLAKPPDYKDCWYQHLTTYIGGDGNLYRCCVTSYNRLGLIGNVAEAGGFKALWESEMKRQRFASFDARACKACQFNDKNRMLDAALKLDTLPAVPEGLVHPFFV